MTEEWVEVICFIVFSLYMFLCGYLIGIRHENKRIREQLQCNGDEE